jgi:flagellar basal-body rod modification protein FlgD
MTQTTASISSNGTAVSPDTAVSNPAAQLDENAFLKLLVAQLQYQDPMSPSDNQQFMQEQAQFSTVEGINNLQKTMTAMQASQSLAQSVALIGKQVSYVTTNGSLEQGVVSSVTSSDGSLTVNVGGADIDPSTIVTVSNAKAAATTTTGTTGTDTTGTGTTSGSSSSPTTTGTTATTGSTAGA